MTPVKYSSFVQKMEKAIAMMANGDFENAQKILQPPGKFGEMAALAEQLAFLGVKLEGREFSLREKISELDGIRKKLRKENKQLRTELQTANAVFPFSNSPSLAAIVSLVKKIAPTDATVLIGGESGTGKELLAKTIHELSDRAGRKFVPINCAALPEQLLEAELFGIEKGVATGVSERSGKFEAAHRGTIFLDEIGDMSMPIQAKVLRVIQEKEVVRVGSLTPKMIDFRLLAATHEDLQTAVSKGSFREDLYYRLNVVSIKMPSLRDRKEDIIPLAKFFCDNFSKRYGRKISNINKEAQTFLLAHDWPGNVRELQNAMERAVVVADKDVISKDEVVLDKPRRSFSGDQEVGSKNRLKHEDKDERDLIFKTLQKFNGSRKLTAEHLGIHRETLRLKMKKHSLM